MFKEIIALRKTYICDTRWVTLFNGGEHCFSAALIITLSCQHAFPGQSYCFTTVTAAKGVLIGRIDDEALRTVGAKIRAAVDNY